MRVCRNGDEAIAAMLARDIDIALVDFAMPKFDGIQVCRKLLDLGRRMPVVVFITALAHCAADAFQVGVSGFLLKPYDRRRLTDVLWKAAEIVRGKRAVGQVEVVRSMLTGIDSRSTSGSPIGDTQTRTRWVIRCRGQRQLINACEVDWVESVGRYCLVHCGSTAYRVEGSLAYVCDCLKGASFLRVARSFIINVDKKILLERNVRGDLMIQLASGMKIAVSRRREERVLKLLGG